jgi:hypothetical protein
MHLIVAGATSDYLCVPHILLKIIIPAIIPNIADKLRRILKLIISNVNPNGPVRFALITESEGNIFAINVPRADPRIPPITIKTRKYPIFPLSKFILLGYKHYPLQLKQINSPQAIKDLTSFAS